MQGKFAKVEVVATTHFPGTSPMTTFMAASKDANDSSNFLHGL